MSDKIEAPPVVSQIVTEAVVLERIAAEVAPFKDRERRQLNENTLLQNENILQRQEIARLTNDLKTSRERFAKIRGEMDLLQLRAEPIAKHAAAADKQVATLEKELVALKLYAQDEHNRANDAIRKLQSAMNSLPTMQHARDQAQIRERDAQQALIAAKAEADNLKQTLVLKSSQDVMLHNEIKSLRLAQSLNAASKKGVTA